VIDFVGADLTRLHETPELVADLSSSTGVVGKPVIQRNPFTHGYRAYFDFTPGDEPLAELRCKLRIDTDALTETWSYQWREEKH
jgi:glucans biosynthesis protein